MYAESHFDLCFTFGEGFARLRGTRGTGLERVYAGFIKETLIPGWKSTNVNITELGPVRLFIRL
jgi:hypothetical protein